MNYPVFRSISRGGFSTHPVSRLHRDLSNIVTAGWSCHLLGNAMETQGRMLIKMKVPFEQLRSSPQKIADQSGVNQVKSSCCKSNFRPLIRYKCSLIIIQNAANVCQHALSSMICPNVHAVHRPHRETSESPRAMSADFETLAEISSPAKDDQGLHLFNARSSGSFSVEVR